MMLFLLSISYTSMCKSSRWAICLLSQLFCLEICVYCQIDLELVSLHIFLYHASAVIFVSHFRACFGVVPNFHLILLAHFFFLSYSSFPSPLSFLASAAGRGAKKSITCYQRSLRKAANTFPTWWQQWGVVMRLMLIGISLGQMCLLSVWPH